MIDQILGMGVSPIFATSLMGLLEIHPDELVDSVRFERFKDVLICLKDDKNYSYIVNKLTRGKQIDKLNHVWSYTKLEHEKKRLLEERDGIQRNLDLILRMSGDKQVKDPADVVGYSDHLKMINGVNDSLRKIDEEMGFYEK